MLEKKPGKSLFKSLGINKDILYDVTMRDTSYDPFPGKLNLIRTLKQYADEFDITHISKEERLCIIRRDHHINYAWNELVDDQRMRHYLCHKEIQAYFKKIIRLDEKESGFLLLQSDLVLAYRNVRSIYEQMPELNVNDLPVSDADIYRITSRENTIRLHDVLVEINNHLNDMRSAKERAEMDEKLRKLEKDRTKRFAYEDKNYCIKIPHTVDEVYDEGLKLHHCVKSYAKIYANGETNLLFLRKKRSESTPFYTIEINNNNEVVQIHGKYNRWLGNDPEAIPFVYEYLTKINAKFDKKQLLNTGTGYNPGRTNLNERYLTATTA